MLRLRAASSVGVPHALFAPGSVLMLRKRKRNLVLFALIALGGLAAGGCARSPQDKEARFMSRGKEAMKKKPRRGNLWVDGERY